jgi:hypothetical protein
MDRRGGRVEFKFFAFSFRFRAILGALSYSWIFHLFLNDSKPVFVRFAIFDFYLVCGFKLKN